MCLLNVEGFAIRILQLTHRPYSCRFRAQRRIIFHGVGGKPWHCRYKLTIKAIVQEILSPLTKETAVVSFWICGVIGLSGAFPLVGAIRANLSTSLRQTVMWAAGAWVMWGLSWASLLWGNHSQALVGAYLGLCLTGCAVIAVMGARRPGMQAWNVVVSGLLAVLALPLLEGQGTLRYLSLAQLIFLSAILTLGLLNYLPTRMGLGALLIAGGVTITFVGMVHAPWRVELQRWVLPGTWGLIGLGLWSGWFLRRRGGDEPDSLWCDFRDRYGAVWALRFREQFNQSAKHSNVPVELVWQGMQWKGEKSEAGSEQVMKTLNGLLKRFRAEDQD